MMLDIRSTTRAAALAAMLVGGLSQTVLAQRAERRTLSGRNVGIYNLVGTLRVEGSSSGGDVSVEVTRRGDDGDRLRIETGQIGGMETLRVIYPEGRIRYTGDGRGRNWLGSSRTTINVHDDGTFGGGGDGWRGRRVEISGRDGMDIAADLRVTVPRGQRISLYLGAGEATVSNVDGDILVDVQAASITTNGTRGTLSLDTGSGRVEVTDAEGTLEVDTGSGAATLTRIKGDELTLDTGSGSVKGSSIDVGRLNIDTGSGGVGLGGVRARDIVLDTGSGSIDLDLTDDVESLRVDSGSGGITLTVPRNLGAELVAETGSGGVDIDVPFELRRKERGYLSGRLGDGRGRITIDTGSGSVRIRPSSSARGER
jgi:lia operon protein LiaG